MSGIERSDVSNSEALSKLIDFSRSCIKEKETPSSSNVEAIRPIKSRSAIQEDAERRAFQEVDGRIVPNVEILYKQSVGTEDVFLGWNLKMPSSVNCEMILVKISLPGIEEMNSIQLDCKQNRILLQTHLHKLFHYLPKVVDPSQGRAKWNAKHHELQISLPIIQRGPFLD